jgi:hypothetical protein
MFEDSGESLIETWFKEVIRVARERTVKYPPKRGKLTKRQIDRAVEKVVYARRGGGEAGQTRHVTTIRRDAGTGKFISRNEAEHRAETAVVETIKRPKKKK